MVNCCKNSYRICDSFVGCPAELIVKVPASYTGQSIVIRITKGAASYDYNVSVEDGFATIDFTAYGPDGFINGYGSPLFELFMFDPTTQGIIELQPSGDPVTSVIFQVMAGASNSNQFIINY